MKTKEEIVQNWLPRYTSEKLENFGRYFLLTNFSHYVKLFADWNQVEVVGMDKPMQCATADDITIINFGMGSPTAATVMDLLRDRKSTRLNSSHMSISYAVFCLKKKKFEDGHRLVRATVRETEVEFGG